jgi:hypothetical protein
VEVSEADILFGKYQSCHSLEDWEKIPKEERIDVKASYDGLFYDCVILQVSEYGVDCSSTIKSLREYRQEKNLGIRSLLSLLKNRTRRRERKSRDIFVPLKVSYLCVLCFSVLSRFMAFCDVMK